MPQNDDFKVGNSEQSKQHDGLSPQPEPKMQNLPPLNAKHDKSKEFASPLDEALALHLAVPRSVREFRSFSDLAQHFNVSRMTCYRRKNPVLLERVAWLLSENRFAGNLLIRQNWELIIRGQVRAAIAGSPRAADFCRQEGWPTIDKMMDGTLGK
jgi:hypothetical protein